MHSDGDRFTLALSPLARDVVVNALWQNEGPWDPSDGLARVLGFTDAADLRSATLQRVLRDGEAGAPD